MDEEIMVAYIEMPKPIWWIFKTYLGQYGFKWNVRSR